MYGGRAIDAFDRRILTTYMEEYFGDFIFDTFQEFDQIVKRLAYFTYIIEIDTQIKHL